MKKYILPLALTSLLFMGACSNKIAVQLPQSADRCIEITEELLSVVELDSVRINDPLEVINVGDSLKVRFYIDTNLIFGSGPHCHPWMPYCNSISCPCCNICIIPLPPIGWGDILQIPMVIYTINEDSMIVISNTKEYVFTRRLLLKLKAWQDVTGVQLKPIVVALCEEQGFTFYGEIV